MFPAANHFAPQVNTSHGKKLQKNVTARTLMQEEGNKTEVCLGKPTAIMKKVRWMLTTLEMMKK